MNEKDIVTRCTELQEFWQPRNDKFKEWYELVTLKDKLAQEKMESFVGNDPKTSYNLILHLLTQPDIPHKIGIETIDKKYIPASSEIEDFLSDQAWANIDRLRRARGKQPFKKFLASLLLITGWHAVFAMATDDECIAEVWNPADVYPVYGDEGMVECAHISKLGPAGAKRKFAAKGWEIRSSLIGGVTEYDYWKNDGTVTNTIVCNNEFVKPETPEPRFLGRIPIFIMPVGGLPDTGSIMPDDESWKKHIGESMLAANEPVYAALNKHWTFSQQLLRDTAQPRWFERSRGDKKILNKADIFKRGAIFYGMPEDTIETLAVPPIPVELRTDRLDMEAMLQRGGPPWALFGNIQQTMTAYLMSQMASSAQQMFHPYHQAIIDLISDIDNFWLDMIREYKLSPYGFHLPNMPKKFFVSADYKVQVPGDLAARITMARMMSPQFELSESTTMEMMFPEIRNIIKEQAQIRKDKALRHPANSAIDLIAAFKEQAMLLREAGDIEGAELYEKAAAATEATLGAEMGAPEAGGVGPPAPTGEVPPPAPREQTRPLTTELP